MLNDKQLISPPCSHQPCNRLVVIVVLAISFILPCLPAKAAVIWNFSSTDDSNSVTGTFVTNGETSDLSGSTTHTFTVTELLTLNINGTDVTNPNIIGAPPRNDGEGKFQWDQTNQKLTESTSNWLILQKSDQSELLQIGHGQVTGFRNYTFTSGGISPSASFISTSTIYTPVPEPEEYACIVAGMLLIVASLRKKSSNISQQKLTIKSKF